MGEIIDISLTLQPGMPVWPGSPGFRVVPLASLAEGDPANVSKLEIEVHTGTHVDAPLHVLDGGSAVEDLGLEVLIGAAAVADLRGVSEIRADDLEGLNLPQETRRLLLRTRNSELWRGKVSEFRSDYVALTRDAAQWVVARGIGLVGVDYLSVQRFDDSPETHRILLRSGVVILEGLDLSEVEPGAYELVCLPILLAGAEGAPARAVLRKA